MENKWHWSHRWPVLVRILGYLKKFVSLCVYVLMAYCLYQMWVLGSAEIAKERLERIEIASLPLCLTQYS